MIPKNLKIYHIVHADRLPSIIADGHLWCDRVVIQRRVAGTTIGINNIKHRRLNVLTLTSHPGLYVGDCVPFYFCPRSVMLYVIYRGNNPDLSYRGGQAQIIHLEADLYNVVAWAKGANHNWAFTTSNAGSNYFHDYSDLADLDKINWEAVVAKQWVNYKEYKQAEFLIEHSFPWMLIERIGVASRTTQINVQTALQNATHRPPVNIIPDWYYR